MKYTFVPAVLLILFTLGLIVFNQTEQWCMQSVNMKGHSHSSCYPCSGEARSQVGRVFRSPLQTRLSELQSLKFFVNICIIFIFPNNHIFRHIRKIAKATVTSVMNVCPSAWNKSGLTGLVFMKFDIRVFLENLLRKFKLY
jgi:hypothetical protein